MSSMMSGGPGDSTQGSMSSMMSSMMSGGPRDSTQNPMMSSMMGGGPGDSTQANAQESSPMVGGSSMPGGEGSGGTTPANGAGGTCAPCSTNGAGGTGSGGMETTVPATDPKGKRRRLFSGQISVTHGVFDFSQLTVLKLAQR